MHKNILEKSSFFGLSFDIIVSLFFKDELDFFPVMNQHLQPPGRRSWLKVNESFTERPLRIVYNDYITSFENLLKKNNSFKIHHKNIQLLAVELFKVEKRISNPILCDIFPLRLIDYKLRSQTDFSLSSINTCSFK